MTTASVLRTVGLACAIAASVALMLASLRDEVVRIASPIEALGVVSYAWSAWLLARNSPLGWWVGLVGCAAYAKVFLDAGLRAEVGLQGFYVVTSLQAIWIWMRGGERRPGQRTERPVSRLPRRAWLPLVVTIAASTAAVAWLVASFRDPAAPTWDALVTVLSIAAHLLLMGRYVESWALWLAVDTIAVPLYASRGLGLTSALYAVLWVVALRGLIAFHRAAREREQGESPLPHPPPPSRGREQDAPVARLDASPLPNPPPPSRGREQDAREAGPTAREEEAA